MAPAKGAKKEKVFHPQSRKAAQVERAQLRKSKLSEAASKKVKHTTSLSKYSPSVHQMNVCLPNAYAVDKYVFFFHAIPDDKEAMTLDELHSLVQDVWLARHDVALGEEQKSRRKGRPKSAKEMKLENIKLFESEEYRTGLGACTWPAFICIRYDAGRADVGTRLPIQRCRTSHTRLRSPFIGAGTRRLSNTSTCCASSALIARTPPQSSSRVPGSTNC